MRREQEILDATEQLLPSTPFSQLTMDDIAKHAGLSRSAVYFYFGSKEQVLTALHRRTYDEMARTMDPIADEGKPIVEAMGEAIGRVSVADPSPRPAHVHETAMVSPEFEQEWRQRLEHHVTALTAIIEHLPAGPRRARPRAIASSWFWMLENQFSALFRRDHSRREERELVDTLNILWLRMIGAGGNIGG